ncbi:DUF6999 family protein [Bordetella bronchiseptica]|uniref:Uncharacterized protein n=3 Tax=Bordetella bronchiseptica TaxID=518 RepID=A0A0H3LGC8_BORBR|nr:hypothetical protein [Bordetella bronchiseptica]KAK68521.1 hypothetical protein AZ22_1256 [Bordetella bronchiseptica 980-2]KCV27406.1 hypothetical protein L489_0104 [Bordetella bronchiseptica 00-P-2730]KDD59933.1 hypothetical protein L533_0032 [Bordetella bronchiseptica OSU553]SHS03586.1 Uncharacterised protein [Mycobacteroides abscessus subsp. abscessus]AMG86722.1 hypothetical protein AL472_02005 [Bordetella bronchiseptica]
MSRPEPDFLSQPHDPADPDPWRALYLDRSTPLPDPVKQAWLADSSSASRQYLLPFLRPLARAFIILIQVVKTFLPRRWSHSRLLHRILAWGLEHFVSPQANWLILRHFHLGAQILAFIARNAPVQVETTPLEPARIADLRDELFVKHDLNLFNFVIRLNQALRDAGQTMHAPEQVDYSMIRDPGLRLEDMPQRRRNFLDLQSAIELFTPLYQLMLTDNDFWRAANSLQLDETIGIYAAQLLGAPQHLILVNNKHPLVPMSTLRAGYRLVLHGLSTEMLHSLLMQMKQQQAEQA